MSGANDVEAMGCWLDGALAALIQMGAPIHSFTVHGDSCAVAISLDDGRVITRQHTQAAARRARAHGSTSKVYLIAASSGQIKIGIAQSVKKRLRGLQNAHGDPLTVLAEFEGGRDLEQKLHKALRPYRMKGEWFQRGPWVEALLSGVAKGEGAGQLLRRVRGANAR